jgi:protein-tyrosine phosphatase
MKTVLFICTGNVFRSMVAEYALKTHLGPEAGLVVGSAGTEAVPAELHPLIRDYLVAKGADPSKHAQRKLTAELLECADLPVAMGLNHREFIRRHFSREVRLFNEICYAKMEPVLDVQEAIPDWEQNQEAAYRYALSVIDYIWAATPALIAKLPHL